MTQRIRQAGALARLLARNVTVEHQSFADREGNALAHRMTFEEFVVHRAVAGAIGSLAAAIAIMPTGNPTVLDNVVADLTEIADRLWGGNGYGRTS